MARLPPDQRIPPTGVASLGSARLWVMRRPLADSDAGQWKGRDDHSNGFSEGSLVPVAVPCRVSWV